MAGSGASLTAQNEPARGLSTNKYYRQDNAMSCAAVTKALAHYPVSTQLGGKEYRIRAMSPDDGEALMVFARALPSHDTLYMRRDITRQSGIASWIRELRDGVIYSLLAEDSYGLCGYSSINLNELEWTRHIADLRVTTATRSRGRGLGRLLAVKPSTSPWRSTLRSYWRA